jgi:hypothetical protein
MSNLTHDVINEFGARQIRAIALRHDDPDLWETLARAADLHRPPFPGPGMQLGSLHCKECTAGDYGRVWPGQTLRLIASGLLVKARA